MGVLFYIVNPGKGQYLNPRAFGDFTGTSGYQKGRHPVALAMLTCDSSALGIESPAGSWSGDRVLVVTDAARADQFGIPTATADDPKRNLYAMAWQEFQDISYEAIDMVCKRLPEFADSLAQEAKWEIENESMEFLKTFTLWHLGNALARTECQPLRSALERHLGPAWADLYHEASLLHKYDDEPD